MLEKDELDELIVDENQSSNKALIRDILKGYVTISKNGEIGYENLGQNKWLDLIYKAKLLNTNNLNKVVKNEN